MGKNILSRLLISLIITVIISLIGITAVSGADPGNTIPDEENQSVDGQLLEAEYYAKYFGVSIDEAFHRFKLENAARPLENELSTKYPETFAGLWVEHTPEFKVVVAFTHDGETTIKPYLQGELADTLELRVVKYSYSILQNVQMEFSSILNTFSIKSDSSIDIMDNCVVVNITKPDKIQLDNALQNGKLTIPENINIVTVDALAKPEVNVYGGLKLENLFSYCTSGFAVKNASGTKGILTAGHADNTLWYYWAIPWNLPMQQELLGTYYDVQWHTCPGLTVQNKIRVSSGGSTVDITATKSRTNQLIGEIVSKYGEVTYYTSGTITSKNIILAYIPNCQATFIQIENTFLLPDLSANGDSGGPWYRGNTAYGIHCAGDDQNLYAYYMAIDYVSGLGVSVMTSP